MRVNASMWKSVVTATGVLLGGAFGVVAPAPASAVSRCWGGPTVTDVRGKRFATNTCPTWTGTDVLLQNPPGTATKTGYLYAGNNWVVCQSYGGKNPEFGQGYKNDIWLYTQGDTVTSNGGWGWIPATAVAIGGDWDAIEGVKWCTDVPGFY